MNPLATVDDLEEHLGRALTDAEAARSASLLDGASGAVRTYTGQDFTTAETTARLPVRRRIVRLPQRPVTAVDTVEDTNGNAVAFTWLGDDRVEVAANVPDSWAWVPWSNGITTVDITYTHGYDIVPAEIIDIVCAKVGRVLDAPSANVTAMALGDASQSFGAIGAAGIAGFFPDEKALLDIYRRQVGVITTAP